jgi:hypothetical protein
LFNALLKKQQALVANYPFATIEPNVGIVPVPDRRLDELVKLVKFEKKLDYNPPIIPATVKFVDIAGLVKGASTGAGLGNKFLAHIREVDLICEVVRDFKDENIIREGSVSPQDDIELIKTELELADLEAKEGAPKLAQKPILYVYNVSYQDDQGVLGSQGLRIDAKLEAELAELSQEDQTALLKEYGLEEPGLNRLIRKAYEMLGLISFLTAGDKEVRAWTVKMGTKAPQAAGVIHTDFEKNFIKAEVVAYEDYVGFGGYKRAREAGKVRLEGKEYEVKDGDVIEFKVGV